MTEKQYVVMGGRKILTQVRRHRQARRISLRLTPAGDGVVLTLPKRASLARAMAFLHQKADWVLAHVAHEQISVTLKAGACVPVLGVMHEIRLTQGRGVTRLHENAIEVYGAPEFTARRVKDFLGKHLHQHCHAYAAAMAGQLGKTATSVRIGTMQSRWGSCTSGGKLAFNWRLVFAPAFVVEYLVAHEVAHLAEMNHSPRFWKYVSVLCPEYKHAKAWLRAHGQGLYRFV